MESQGDTIRDDLDAAETAITRSEFGNCGHMRVHGGQRQNPHSHIPFMSSSLPLFRAGSSTGLQLNAVPPIPRSPYSQLLPGIKQPRAQGYEHDGINEDSVKNSIFRTAEEYIVKCFRTCDTLNESFLACRSSAPHRCVSEGTMTTLYDYSHTSNLRFHGEDIFELDAKTLLLGDVAENGAWWLGKTHHESVYPESKVPVLCEAAVTRPSLKLPRIDLVQLRRWYQVVLTAGLDWRVKIQRRPGSLCADDSLNKDLEARLEVDFAESCKHLQKTLFKATDTLLRRPGRPIKTLTDCRFLFLLLENPLLYSVPSRNDEILTHYGRNPPMGHMGLVKRVLGLMANLSTENHRHLISWFSRYTKAALRRLVDLVGGFVTHRLMRQRQASNGNQRQDFVSVLVPEFIGSGAGTSAQLHAALGTGVKASSPKALHGKCIYHDDWQIKAAAKVMSLLFQANTSSAQRHQLLFEDHDPKSEGPAVHHQHMSDPVRHGNGTTANNADRGSPLLTRKQKRLLPTSAFYNTLLDYCDLIADFETWENGRATFSFCQYPMFLSIWAKIRILEYDARRQMEIKARQAFFNSIMSRQAVSQYLVLKIRRECLVEDSLRGVSEVVGSGQEDIKKGLRIAFQDEEGVDAGGLRKEWFLLLVREVFDPEHGLFVYDDESHYCYFNPSTFETSDQYFLIGVVLGLAIYNSTILDVALPPFAFRKLLASAPAYTGPSTSLSRPSATLGLSDLAELRPSLASGLQQLLEYDGNVEETFCRDFVVDIDRYGQHLQVPLCLNGENRTVTSSNRAEFVDLYVKYLLDTSVSRQFEPFKRGFFSVCGCNALSLFRPDEIELLVRGSDEPLDVATLQAVAIYDGWQQDERTGDDAVIAWFWALFSEALPREQRALLSFITGSDRLPAMGATSLIIKVTCLGRDTRRFPLARTCFNMIGLYRYLNKDTLRRKLWTAVTESEGFGLK
ncbi:MAG: hypothetical protein L6R35_005998 [Caloplaca aegaea]|nr:MAG: hypothetical protein L6R35_005998 [Caloplaca aegaea]